MRHLISTAILAGLVACAAVPAAAAQPAPDSETPAEAPAPAVDVGEDPGGWVEATYEAVRSGEWILAAALGVIGLVYVARRWGGQLVPWLTTDRGGVALALVTSVLGAAAHAVAAGDGLSLALAGDALGVGLAAIGGYAGLRRLLWPRDGEGAA